EMIQRLDYTTPAFDDAFGFSWESDFIHYVEQNDKPLPHWNDVISKRPSLLRFWYRESPQPLISTDFVDDLLTPGIVTTVPPPVVQSRMIDVAMDSEGRLISFHAIPDQRHEPGKQIGQLDWNPLFIAAGLDIGQFHVTEPLWTDLAAADMRMAWLGT